MAKNEQQRKQSTKNGEYPIGQYILEDGGTKTTLDRAVQRDGGTKTTLDRAVQRDGGTKTTLDRAVQRDGSCKWVIRRSDMCLTKEGDWIFEPTPSNRSDEFLYLARFDSVEEAIIAWERNKND